MPYRPKVPFNRHPHLFTSIYLLHVSSFLVTSKSENVLMFKLEIIVFLECFLLSQIRLLLNLCLVSPSCGLHHISLNSWFLIRLLGKLPISLLAWKLWLESEFFQVSLLSLGIYESCQNIFFFLIHLKIPALLLILLIHHCLFQSAPSSVRDLRLIWQQWHLDSNWRSLHALVIRVLTSNCSSHRWY